MAAVRTSAPWRMPRVWGIGKRYWDWGVEVEGWWLIASGREMGVGGWWLAVGGRGLVASGWGCQSPRQRWCQALGECHGLGVLGKGTGVGGYLILLFIREKSRVCGSQPLEPQGLGCPSEQAE